MNQKRLNTQSLVLLSGLASVVGASWYMFNLSEPAAGDALGQPEALREQANAADALEIAGPARVASQPRGSQGPPESASVFLEIYDRGEFVRQQLAEKGVSPDEMPPIKPLDELWPDILDEIRFSAEEREALMRDLAGWGPNDDISYIASALNFNLRGKDIARGDLEPLLVGEASQVRWAVNQRCDLFEKAYADAIARNDFIASPLVHDHELNADYRSRLELRGRIFHSTLFNVEGWVISINLTELDYPQLYQAHQEVLTTYTEQSIKAQELVDGW